MKKATLSIFTLFVSSALVIAQNNKTSEVTICKSSAASMNVVELEKCNIILPVDEKLKVKSFTVSFLVNGKNEDAFIDFAVEGNHFSPAALSALKEKSASISKVLIKDVIAIDGARNEKRIPGTEILLLK
jgi:hypothetical protein